MSYAVCITGEKPEGFAQAFAELAPLLQMEDCAQGQSILLQKGEKLTVEQTAEHIVITYATPIQVYRALSHAKQFLSGACASVSETPCFETLGIMVDASRNAVPNVAGLKSFIKKMALMGVNLIMMYTEDTYEVPAYPYFGYMRGRYTYEELKELDDYAFQFGMEMCPCIQTLGHLNRAIRWPKMYHLADNGEVLLADSDATYEFIEKIIESATKPYRSKRIHIGMDEAHGVGLGSHLRKFGYEEPHAIIERHLKRVTDITKKLGLSTIMWSDMYFRPDSPTNSYYDAEVSQKAIDSVVPGVELMYWDYYHNTEEAYDAMFEKHRKLGAQTSFAGAIWVFTGPAPDYEHTVQNTVPALTSAHKANMKTVLATAWGDNGAESNIATIMPGVQLYAEYCYAQNTSMEHLASRFTACTGGDFSAFWGLSKFNRITGMKHGETRPVNAAKMLLYQDPMVQLFAKDMEGVAMEAHYAALANEYSVYAKAEGEYQPLFQFYYSLANVLKGKCHWFEHAKACVLDADKTKAEALCTETEAVVAEIETLRKAWWALWSSTNKPFGFEVLDGRMGAIQARMQSACDRMRAHMNAQDDMAELLETVLDYTKGADGILFGSYAVGEIFSACKIDV